VLHALGEFTRPDLALAVEADQPQQLIGIAGRHIIELGEKLEVFPRRQFAIDIGLLKGHADPVEHAVFQVFDIVAGD